MGGGECEVIICLFLQSAALQFDVNSEVHALLYKSTYSILQAYSVAVHNETIFHMWQLVACTCSDLFFFNPYKPCR